MRSKKGQTLQALPGLVILLVVVAIVLSVGADIVDNIQDGFDDNSYADNASEEGLKGINEVAESIQGQP